MRLAKKALVFSLAFPLLCVAACGPRSSAPIALTETDAGKTITLNRGDTLVVTLPGNVTTGYTWEMVPQDITVLQQVGAPGVTPDSNLPGASGKIAIKFEAVKTGQASLQLIYHRPFEKDVPPQKTFKVTIVVK